VFFVFDFTDFNSHYCTVYLNKQQSRYAG